MYSCGPTVYQAASIGNFRAFLFADLLRRGLEFLGYEVKQIMNITDVGHLTDDADSGEDKMIVGMQKEGKTAWEIADVYTEMFLRDMDRLHILRPAVMPKATEHIPEQIELIQVLEEKAFTYKTSDGIYFDTSKLADYGALAHQKQEEKEAGARVEVNPEKRNPADFALWKFSPTDQKRNMEWESPWGVGFPGWHIECSAMSEEYLGSPFDIHTGGEDHIPVHHPNEMAQTEAARGHALANVWIHNAFLQVDGGKMGKSLGNAYTLDDLMDKGIEPLAYRYFILQAHYKTPQNFTWESVQAAQNALNNLRDELRTLSASTEVNTDALERFKAAIADDVNAPAAVAELHNVLNNNAIDSGSKSATVLKFDEFLGLGLPDYVATPLLVPAEVQELMEERQNAREAKDWERADALRDEIAEKGFLVEDGASDQSVREKHE